jgi:hypothetical protein
MARVRIDELIARRRKSSYIDVARSVMKHRSAANEKALFLALWKLNRGRARFVDPHELMAIAEYFQEYDVRNLIQTEDDGA